MLFGPLLCGALRRCYLREIVLLWGFLIFFFQAEDGIRDLVRSRGLGDVYKRQDRFFAEFEHLIQRFGLCLGARKAIENKTVGFHMLSLIHI